MKKIILGLVMLFALVACSNENNTQNDKALEIEVYDGGNLTTQSFDATPNRVVCNNVSSAEILIELGLKDKIVGMYDPDDIVESKYKDDIDDIVKLGDKKTISNEIILSVEPDIIVGRSSADETIPLWNSFGVNVYYQKTSAQITQDISYVIEDVINLGKIFDVEEKANEYVKILEKQINVLENQFNKDDLKNAILMCNFSGSTYGAYKSNFQEALLNTIGYTNAASKGSSFSLENLIQTNPSLIIYVKASRNQANDSNAIEKLYNTEEISEVDAIKNKRVIELTYVSMMDYGPEAINTLIKIGEFISDK